MGLTSTQCQRVEPKKGTTKRECLLARRPTDLVFISALGTDLFSLGDRPHHAAVNSERRAGSGACGFSAEINN